MAVRALLDDDLLGQALSMTGPEGLAMAEQVENLGQALERPLRFEEIGPEAAKQAMLSVHAWMKEAAVDSLLSYLAHSVGHSAPVTQEVPRVLGRPAGPSCSGPRITRTRSGAEEARARPAEPRNPASKPQLNGFRRSRGVA
ncbi:hypothetical protein ACIPWY_06495 [Streptomyces sp. NPDC090032]|uniref:hypothetical protein n=1 Tax=unclassified Streptomyces TaxID=2593676 RepID=UPI00371DB301